MSEDAMPPSINGWSRAELRRRNRAARERGERLRNERVRFLETQLEPGERIVAQSRGHPIITDRRILWARRLSAPPRQGDWVCDALAFDEITSYAFGRRHDQRPMIRLEHRSIERTERIPAHRLLWFQWGEADGPVPHDTTLLGFGKGSDPVFVALRETLERAPVVKLEPFVIRPEGTRQERIAPTSMLFERPTRWRSARSLLREVTEYFYRGHVSWRVRIPSWLILAVPAWFIEPWLVLPAIVVVEIGWIVALQWSWRRDQRRARQRLGG
jgi:hypothetical protein